MSSLAGALEPVSKRTRTEPPPPKLIGTHNGTFHCDEALAVFLLRLTDAYKDAHLVRTRDPAKLAQCDIVVDVGGVYDVETQRFDHHQRGFEEVLGEDKYHAIKLSSAGLVYKHFGREIVAKRIGVPITHPDVDMLFLKLYGIFIEPIDAIDNGISQYDVILGFEAMYKIRTDLSSRISWLNPTWLESADEKAIDERFQKASDLAGGEFLNRLDFYAKAWLPARDLVMEALKRRKEVHHSGNIVVFERFVPWKEHLFSLEDALGTTRNEKVLYVLYMDEGAGNWRIQAVPVRSEGFENRKSLPEVWRGLRDDELSEKSGIPGCIFVHSSGFIGGNKTKEGVLLMAKAALKM
ncbi:GAMM1 protein [Hysterangium stoloniferum]|nr:GAMM1 protein [Hysterangium stoloniferum]